MSEELFEKLDELEMGDRIRIHFPDDHPAAVEGIKIDNPFETTVQIVRRQRLDEKEGHDVDGIVMKNEIYLEPPDYDDKHEEYVIETERPMAGENKYSPIHARDYFEGRPGDGKWAIHSIGFIDIEVLDQGQE